MREQSRVRRWQGKKEKWKKRRVESGSVIPVHPKPTPPLRDGKYCPREEGTQQGMAASTGNNRGRKWEGVIQVPALDVVCPNSAICFKALFSQTNWASATNVFL